MASFLHCFLAAVLPTHWPCCNIVCPGTRNEIAANSKMQELEQSIAVQWALVNLVVVDKKEIWTTF